ncbi:hypothetical protein ES703_12669 [subsurface metagenome]
MLKAKSDLGLGRMDIDVNIIAGKGDIEHRYRMPPHHEHSLIGVLHGAAQEAAPNPAPIDEEAEVAAAGARKRRGADKARDAGQQLPFFYLDHGLGGLQPIDLDQGIAQAATSRGLKSHPPLDDEAEPHLGEGEAILAHQIGDVTAFRCHRLEEFEASRNIAEEIAHRDRGPLRAASFLFFDHCAIFEGEVGSRYLTCGAGQNLYFGDGGDAGQRLTPEAKAGNGFEVGHDVDLACGVAMEGKLDLIGGDADAVIADPDQANPAATSLD